MWDNLEHSLPLASDTLQLMEHLSVTVDSIRKVLRSDFSESAVNAAMQMLDDVSERVRDFLSQDAAVRSEEIEKWRKSDGMGLERRKEDDNGVGGGRKELPPFCHVPDKEKLRETPSGYLFAAQARKASASAYRAGKRRRFPKRGKKR